MVDAARETDEKTSVNKKGKQRLVKVLKAEDEKKFFFESRWICRKHLRNYI